MNEIRIFIKEVINSVYSDISRLDILIGLLGLSGIVLSSYIKGWAALYTMTCVFFIFTLRAAYKAWVKIYKKESKGPDVNLLIPVPNVNYKVQASDYSIGPFQKFTFRILGELINASQEYSGDLRHFAMTIYPAGMDESYALTTLSAVVQNPSIGYKFSVNHVYNSRAYFFIIKLPAAESWEPYIQGAKAIVKLQVQGQDDREYELKVDNTRSVF